MEFSAPIPWDVVGARQNKGRRQTQPYLCDGSRYIAPSLLISEEVTGQDQLQLLFVSASPYLCHILNCAPDSCSFKVGLARASPSLRMQPIFVAEGVALLCDQILWLAISRGGILLRDVQKRVWGTPGSLQVCLACSSVVL